MLEQLVVYRQEYGERGLWVRPAVMVAETVMVDGSVVPRATRFSSRIPPSAPTSSNRAGRTVAVLRFWTRQASLPRGLRMRRVLR